MRKLEYKIAVSLQVNGDDTTPVARLVDTIRAAGGTAEVKTIKPVRQPRAEKTEAAPAAPSAS